MMYCVARGCSPPRPEHRRAGYRTARPVRPSVASRPPQPEQRPGPRPRLPPRAARCRAGDAYLPPVLLATHRTGPAAVDRESAGLVLVTLVRARTRTE